MGCMCAGKLFSKLDATGDGHVSVQAFVAYFEEISTTRGSGAAEGLLKHMEKFVKKMSKKKGQAVAVEQLVNDKQTEWAEQLSVLSAEQLAKVEALHKAFDQLGDGNGTVEKEELEAVDKRGKLFDKLDTSSSGHVTVEAFQAFFGKMCQERGEQAPIKLMAHMEKHIDVQKARQESVKAMELAKAIEWETAASAMTPDLRNRARLIFIGIDQQYGDANGTIEKEELKTFDKNGKFFAKIDCSQTEHVVSEGFEAYLGTMFTERGEKAVGGFLCHLEKRLNLGKEAPPAPAAAPKKAAPPPPAAPKEVAPAPAAEAAPPAAPAPAAEAAAPAAEE